jgi:Domain of unknown function (DUF397)
MCLRPCHAQTCRAGLAQLACEAGGVPVLSILTSTSTSQGRGFFYAQDAIPTGEVSGLAVTLQSRTLSEKVVSRMSRRSSQATTDTEVPWHRASPDSSGDSVEVSVQGRMIMLRHSKDPAAGVLCYTVEEFQSFLRGVQTGEFDDLCGVGLSLPGPTPREDRPPESQVDADDRLSVRVERNPEWCKRQMMFENHRDKLKTRQMYRDLVFYSGLMALSAVMAYLLKRAHFPESDAVHFAMVAFISTVAGAGLGRLVSKLKRGNASSHLRHNATHLDSEDRDPSPEQ